MKKSILEIYSLAVCFAGIIAIVISLSISLYNIIELIDPEFGISKWEYEKHLSNENFWTNDNKPIAADVKDEKPSEEEITKLREESYKNVLITSQLESKKSLIRSIIFLMISSAVFFFHWKIFKKSHSKNLE
ncbi:MAG: hypothetical protein CR986_09910 [Ignavibacteriae bacterium]|nr:MAG: hypothetical protein CR986_09910 [Ignavibacteriota bacterium]